MIKRTQSKSETQRAVDSLMEDASVTEILNAMIENLGAERDRLRRRGFAKAGNEAALLCVKIAGVSIDIDKIYEGEKLEDGNV